MVQVLPSSDANQMTHAQEGMMSTAGVHFMVMAVVAVYSVLVSVSVLVTG